MSISSSILRTLVYADIFDYPLNPEELYHFIISDQPFSFSFFKKALTRIHTNEKRIDTNENYFFLKGRREIVNIRKDRERWSEEKNRIARRTANKLKIISTIKMIGVTGALAMNNCKENDDIDLLIITSRNSLWLTRLWLNLITPLLKIKRRKPKDINVNNKICFNLFLDEDHLKIEPENLFLAHEIAQVKVIYDKGGIYEKFIQENGWVREYLPNALDSSKFKMQSSKLQSKIQNLFSPIFRILNKVAYKLQLWYMKSKITIEKVGLHTAFFHPNNLSGEIEKKYKEKLYSLGLDKERN